MLSGSPRRLLTQRESQARGLSFDPVDLWSIELERATGDGPSPAEHGTRDHPAALREQCAIPATRSRSGRFSVYGVFVGSQEITSASACGTAQDSAEAPATVVVSARRWSSRGQRQEGGKGRRILRTTVPAATTTLSHRRVPGSVEALNCRADGSRRGDVPVVPAHCVILGEVTYPCSGDPGPTCHPSIIEAPVRVHWR